MGVGFGIRNGLGYWQWSWKGLRQPSRPAAPLYRRDRRATTDVLCGTNHLYDQCLVESTAQTKLVRHTEHEIQQHCSSSMWTQLMIRKDISFPAVQPTKCTVHYLTQNMDVIDFNRIEVILVVGLLLIITVVIWWPGCVWIYPLIFC